MITELLELISKIKYIKKEELILDEDDLFFLKQYYKLYDMKKVCNFFTYKKIVKDYTIRNRITIPKSCEILTKEIIKNYGR